MKACCFIGHRKICVSEVFYESLKSVVENLIENGIGIFLFGSRSDFDAACWKVVAELKGKYPFIKRAFVRAEYEYIDKSYEDYLLQNYELTYFAQNAHNAGKLVYIKRNQQMIENSDVCVFYYDKDSALRAEGSSSGTKLAFQYAVQKNKKIINLVDILALCE